MKVKRWQVSGMLVLHVIWVICTSSIGCMNRAACVDPDPSVPRELQMTTLPPYVVEPPDILFINTLRVVPKPPYRIQPLDAIYIQGQDVLPDVPIRGAYGIDPDGTVNLGIAYGVVRVAGMTIEQAQAAIQNYLKQNVVKDPKIQVSLAQSRGMMQVQGIHLVRMDGTISLGIYGNLYITGMTIDQARKAIEQFLGQSLLEPEIAIDVYSYNSKWYYIVADRAGFGSNVLRLPITGRDTVLDALSQIGGTLPLSSNRHMWVARPNGQDPKCQQILPVDWLALVKGGSPATNYQLLPGDRLYIDSNPLLKAQNYLNMALAPIEREMGFDLLTVSLLSSIKSFSLLTKSNPSQTVNFANGF
jgi:protein involved in polysaccharide export with SLBB domain